MFSLQDLLAAVRKLDWEAVTLKKQAAAAARKLADPTPPAKGERPHPSAPALLEAHAAALDAILGPVKVLRRLLTALLFFSLVLFVLCDD